MSETAESKPQGACARFTEAIGGPVNYLLVSIVVAAALWGADASPVAQFIFSALAVMPLAAVMGDATEHIAEFAGPAVGGLLNATFGNAAELILGLFSVFNHLDTLVKASITGSIIGNVLLVMGMSMFAGGVKYKTQTFNKSAVGTSATLCVMTSIAITIPAVTQTGANSNAENHLSVGTSVILIVCYCTMLFFSLYTHKDLYDETGGGESEKESSPKEASPEKKTDVQLEERSSSTIEDRPDRPSKVEEQPSSNDIESGTKSTNLPITRKRTQTSTTRNLDVFSKPAIPHEDKPEHSKKVLYKAILTLCVASALVAWMSEILVGAVEAAGEAIGVSKIFMGVIIVAVVGNAAEHSTAIMTAVKNHMDVSINIALGSALQIAMFVGPVLCLCSYARDHPMDLVFSNLEVFAILLALVVVWMVVQDGESTWMEGCLLCMLYLILAIAFLFVSDDTSEG